jgi:Ca-activated chloride channel homolog
MPALSLPGFLRIDVDLVTLSLSARDKDRHYVDNLRAEDLALIEDEVPQEITHFSQEPLPLSAVILLDLSGSTKEFYRDMKVATRVLGELLAPEDEAAVIAFSNQPWILHEFTSKKSYLPLAVERLKYSFSGATNIYDSVFLAVKKLNDAPSNRRRLIVLISDGRGNRGEPERALVELRASDATLLGISLGQVSRFFRATGTFGSLAKESGGKILTFGPSLQRALRESLQQVRSNYAIGFISTNKKRDGDFRHLKLQISNHSPLASRGLVLQNPDGYFAAGNSFMPH